MRKPRLYREVKQQWRRGKKWRCRVKSYKGKLMRCKGRSTNIVKLLKISNKKIKVYQEGKKKLAALVQVAQGELHLKQKEKTRYRQEISKMDRSAHGMSEKMKDALISTAQLVHRIESTRVSANRPTSASKSRPESRQSRPPSRSSATPSTVNTNATRKTDSSK
eukprot:TRINITY_DN3077_c0_g1_i4.p1 TRINITY_DN3077_c0_g1~~TRINITY_DN3077_c0_g1_i4.p1  ORF type:complete len:164 (-),score=36.25 TRINITY_DN3077_c0_g1_i4:152-643(-)